MPIIHFSVTESAFNTAKSDLIGTKAISRSVFVTKLFCASTIARIKASACYCETPSAFSQFNYGYLGIKSYGGHRLNFSD